MQDVRDRKTGRAWFVAAALAVGCIAAGTFVTANASGSGDDAKDDDVHKKKDVRVIVSSDGNEPNVWVSGDDDDEEEGHAGAFLGVSTEEDTKNPDGGARVTSVTQDSPADKAGLHRGDTIVSFGGTTIHGPARLTEKIHATKPGDKIDLKVHRKEGKTESLTVEMGERPKMKGFGYAFGGDGFGQIPDIEGLDKLGDLGKKLRVLRTPSARFYWNGNRPRLGVELVETTPELREFLGGSKEAGVLIGKVLANTPAQRAGLKVGDLIVAVDGKKIEEYGELVDAMDDKEGKTVDIEVVRDRRSTRVQVTIPKQEETDDQPTGPRAMQGSPWMSEQDQERVRALQAEILAHRAAIDSSRADQAQRIEDASEAREARESMMRARQEAAQARRRALEDRRRMEMEAEALRAARIL